MKDAINAQPQAPALTVRFQMKVCRVFTRGIEQDQAREFAGIGVVGRGGFRGWVGPALEQFGDGFGERAEPCRIVFGQVHDSLAAT